MATATMDPFACAASARAEKSFIEPFTSGYCTRMPEISLTSADSGEKAVEASPTISLIPKPFARVRRTASVCGDTPASTKKDFFR